MTMVSTSLYVHRGQGFIEDSLLLNVDQLSSDDDVLVFGRLQCIRHEHLSVCL
jgi:hypothetical protein